MIFYKQSTKNNFKLFSKLDFSMLKKTDYNFNYNHPKPNPLIAQTVLDQEVGLERGETQTINITFIENYIPETGENISYRNFFYRQPPFYNQRDDYFVINQHWNDRIFEQNRLLNLYYTNLSLYKRELYNLRENDPQAYADSLLLLRYKNIKLYQKFMKQDEFYYYLNLVYKEESKKTVMSFMNCQNPDALRIWLKAVHAKTDEFHAISIKNDNCFSLSNVLKKIIHELINPDFNCCLVLQIIRAFFYTVNSLFEFFFSLI